MATKTRTKETKPVETVENNPTCNDVHEALAAVQAKLWGIEKDSRNPHFKSRYVSLSKMVQVLYPILHEHGLHVRHFVFNGGYLCTRIIHNASGTHVESAIPLTAGKPQDMGSQLTYFRRYNLGLLTGIVESEDDDANLTIQPPAAEPAAAPVTGAASTVEQLRMRITAASNMGELAKIGATIKGMTNSLRQEERDELAAAWSNRRDELTDPGL